MNYNSLGQCDNRKVAGATATEATRSSPGLAAESPRAPLAERVAQELAGLMSRLNALCERVHTMADRVCGSQPEKPNENAPSPPPNGLLNAMADSLRYGHSQISEIERHLNRLEREGL